MIREVPTCHSQEHGESPTPSALGFLGESTGARALGQLPTWEWAVSVLLQAHGWPKVFPQASQAGRPAVGAAGVHFQPMRGGEHLWGEEVRPGAARGRGCLSAMAGRTEEGAIP